MGLVCGELRWRIGDTKGYWTKVQLFHGNE